MSDERREYKPFKGNVDPRSNEGAARTAAHLERMGVKTTDGRSIREVVNERLQQRDNRRK